VSLLSSHHRRPAQEKPARVNRFAIVALVANIDDDSAACLQVPRRRHLKVVMRDVKGVVSRSRLLSKRAHGAEETAMPGSSIICRRVTKVHFNKTRE
jgi:hypothetical protein